MPKIAPILLAGLFLSGTIPAGAAEPITLEDMLNAESFDMAQFSPDGSALVISVDAAPGSRPTWGYDDAGGQRVFVATPGSALTEIPPASDARYGLARISSHASLSAWAPDGRGVLLVEFRPDSYRLAYYDVVSRKIMAFPGRIAWASLPTAAWTGDGRLVFATIAVSVRQIGAPGQMLRDVSARWRAAWEGDSPRITLHSANPVFAAHQAGQGALMLADPRSGAVRKIADGDYLGITAPSSGRYFAAVAAAETKTDSLSWRGRRGELQIFAARGGKARMLHRYGDMDAAAYQGIVWSPSGNRLLVAARPAGAEKAGARLYVIDAAGGNRRELAAEGLSFQRVGIDSAIPYPIGWLGERPAAIAVQAAEGVKAPLIESATGAITLEYGDKRGFRADLFAFGGGQPENLTAFAKSSVRDFIAAQDGSALVLADGALWKVAPGKKAARLTAEDAPPFVAFGIDSVDPPPAVQTAYYHKGDVERVSLVAVESGKARRFVLDLKSGVLARLDSRGDIVATGPDQRTVLVRSDEGWVSSLARHDSTGKKRVLMTLNAGLKSKLAATVEKFTYSYGGRALTGYVIWPPNAKPDDTLPAVVTVYGGTVYGDQIPYRAKPGVGMPIFSGQLLAAAGYAVIYPSTPLGRGADSDHMETLAESVTAAIDALAVGGRINPDRVGVMGHSFGGLSAAALLAKRSDRFRAGVSLAGLYDYFHGWGMRMLTETLSDDAIGLSWARFVEEGQGQLGAPFWKTPEAYIRNSPIFHVETLDSPLLMLHGDLDIGPTDLSGAERMYTALLRAGKKPVLVHYWGEGHVAHSAPAMRDQWSRITTWFAHYLKDERVSRQ